MDGEVTLMAKEVERLRVVVAVEAGEISRGTAAMQLGITDLHQSHDGRSDSQAGRALATLADNPEAGVGAAVHALISRLIHCHDKEICLGRTTLEGQSKPPTGAR